jgi:hypothetical protein
MPRAVRGFLRGQDNSLHVLARAALRRRQFPAIARAEAARDQPAVLGTQQPADRIPGDA